MYKKMAERVLSRRDRFHILYCITANIDNAKMAACFSGVKIIKFVQSQSLNDTINPKTKT